MNRGVYAAAAGMITQRERLDVVANNLANISTVGFKRSEPISRGFYQVFSDQIARFAPQRGSTDIPGGGSVLDATFDDFSPGVIIDTGNPFDVAIDGPGFFVVETPAGPRYTRAGNLTLDGEGRLINQNGYPIRGQQGPIVTRGETVEISPEGEILVDGVVAEQLAVVDFPKPYKLSRYGQNLYAASDEVRGTAMRVETTELRVGSLEHSNVNPIEELAKMMDAERTYETHQRVILSINDTLDTAVNEIART